MGRIQTFHHDYLLFLSCVCLVSLLVHNYVMFMQVQ